MARAARHGRADRAAELGVEGDGARRAVGWLRAEGQILRSLEIAKQAVGLQSAVTDQLAVAHYLATYDLDAHIAQRRRRLPRAPRRDGRRPRPRGCRRARRVTRPEGGMFLWARVGGAVDTACVLPTAVDAGRRLRARLAVLRRRPRPLDDAAVLRHERPST